MKAKFTRIFLFILVVAAISCCKKNEADVQEPDPPVPVDTVYYRGMDLSFQPEISDWQTPYYDASGEPVDLLPFVAGQGVNLVRLRLWHTPDNEYSGLESVVAFAAKVKAAGMDILLDFHYSDTWADPGKQHIPKAWEDLSLELLGDSLYNYTLNVMNRFKAAGALPSMVQIGNETNSGFLWNKGRVGGSFENNWGNYTQLVKRAIEAVREVEEEKRIRVMLHYAGVNAATWYFDNILQHAVDYDVIGLSYYSIFHGTSYKTWESKFFQIASRYEQEIMVVETGYPWTLQWNDWTNNIYGLEEQLIPDIPATPEGQKIFFERLHESISSIGSKGIGYCFWAADWVAYKGPEATDASTWENVAAFDFENKALPVFQAFSGK